LRYARRHRVDRLCHADGRSRGIAIGNGRSPGCYKWQAIRKGTLGSKKPRGRLWQATYLTAIDGYLLEVYVESFDRETAEKLEAFVERTTFFDPSKASAVAGANSKPYNPLRSDRAEPK